jgi:hypothetical protein
MHLKVRLSNSLDIILGGLSKLTLTLLQYGHLYEYFSTDLMQFEHIKRSQHFTITGLAHIFRQIMQVRSSTFVVTARSEIGILYDSILSSILKMNIKIFK